MVILGIRINVRHFHIFELINNATIFSSEYIHKDTWHYSMFWWSFSSHKDKSLSFCNFYLQRYVDLYDWYQLCNIPPMINLSLLVIHLNLWLLLGCEMWLGFCKNVSRTLLVFSFSIWLHCYCLCRSFLVLWTSFVLKGRKTTSIL